MIFKKLIVLKLVKETTNICTFTDLVISNLVQIQLQQKCQDYALYLSSKN